MRKSVFLAVIALVMLIICSCTSESKDAVVMSVDFEWQPIDKGSQENPEIRITAVPEDDEMGQTNNATLCKDGEPGTKDRVSCDVQNRPGRVSI